MPTYDLAVSESFTITPTDFGVGPVKVSATFADEFRTPHAFKAVSLTVNVRDEYRADVGYLATGRYRY